MGLMRCLLALLCITPAFAGAANAQASDGWDHYGGSQAGLQYSSLDQINRANVTELEEVWRFRTGELGEEGESFTFEANPVLVDGRLYLSTGTAVIIALDPATGAEIWRHDPEVDRSRAGTLYINRGVTSWIDVDADTDAPCRHRIITGTTDGRIIEVDGATGEPCQDFGEAGHVWMDRDVEMPPRDYMVYSITSPPVVVGDVMVVGSAIADNTRVDEARGIVRGLDVRTGEERWRWNPIPRTPDDPAYAGWRPEEAAIQGGANAWPPLAADEELGLVYVPTGSPSPDLYGGEREGDNVYANSLVALRAETGELVWYQQLVHHDVWDYDLPAQPTLVDLRHDGEVIPAVIQATKMGMLFTFNRETGEPIFDIEERAVPQGGVEGEHLSPTQPFPVAPPAYVRQHPLTPDDAWGVMLFDTWSCESTFERLRSEGIYTPPSIEGTVTFPGSGGGSNWGGLAFDPEDQIAIVNANDVALEVALIPRDVLGDVYRSGDYDDFEFARQDGTPYGMRRRAILSLMLCTSPPWSTLTAIDMVEGVINWQVPLGTLDDLLPSFLPSFEVGGVSQGGPIVTAGGLVFIGGSADYYLRAFDIGSGEELWKAHLPTSAQATPMTYYLDDTGRQYVVIAVGGHYGLADIGVPTGDYVIAFALPDGT